MVFYPPHQWTFPIVWHNSDRSNIKKKHTLTLLLHMWKNMFKSNCGCDADDAIKEWSAICMCFVRFYCALYRSKGYSYPLWCCFDRRSFSWVMPRHHCTRTVHIYTYSLPFFCGVSSVTLGSVWCISLCDREPHILPHHEAIEGDLRWSEEHNPLEFRS